MCAGQTRPVTRVAPVPPRRQNDETQQSLDSVFPWKSILQGQQTRPAGAQKVGDGGGLVGGGGGGGVN